MRTARHTTDLTEGSIRKTLILFFIPIAAGNLFQQLYNTADALIIARFVGREALAAVGGSSAQVVNIIVNIFTALSGGASVTIAQAYGSGHDERISQASNTAVVLGVILGALSTVLVYIYTPAIMLFMKTPEDTVEGAVLYMRIYSYGMIFNMLYNMGSGILRAVGDSKRPLYALIACCITNIFLDVLFVAVFHMGVAGVAWATIISQFISAVFVMFYLCGTGDAYKVSFSRLCFKARSLRRILGIGIPTALQASMYSVSNFIIQIALNPLGTVAVASWSMAGKLDGVYWALTNAFGVAIMSFSGQNFGAGKRERIRVCARQSMIMSVISTVALSGVILLFSKYGMHILIEDAEVIRCTWLILTYFVPYYFLWTATEVFSGILRGMGDTVIPVFLIALGICGVRIAWTIFVFPLMHTIKGLSMCYPISWVVTDAAIVVYYFIKSRRVLHD